MTSTRTAANGNACAARSGVRDDLVNLDAIGRPVLGRVRASPLGGAVRRLLGLEHDKARAGVAVARPIAGDEARGAGHLRDYQIADLAFGCFGVIQRYGDDYGVHYCPSFCWCSSTYSQLVS